MIDVVTKEKLTRATQRFFEETFEECGLSESDFSQLLLGIAYRLCIDSGATLNDVLEFLKAHAGE